MCTYNFGDSWSIPIKLCHMMRHLVDTTKWVQFLGGKTPQEFEGAKNGKN